MTTDFIVIGSGLSGLTSALTLQKYGEVLLVSKGKLSDCATNLAQGGIAATVLEDDSFASHIEDTLIAGSQHNNQEAVEYMVKNAPYAIDWLVDQGVRFERENSHFFPTREAAHSHRRILHATDFTGREIEKTLLERVKSQKNITVWENCFAVNLLVSDKNCVGIQVTADGEIINYFSRAVILATGGAGQLYQWTTNPIGATGDGLALGVRAGALVSDLEFIQFHPTALKHGQSPLFLLSEALRGEGAYLIKVKSQKSKVKNNEKEERFMAEYDSRMELAPRDIVARAIFREQQEGYGIYLDIRHKERDFLQKRFPNIYKELKNRGFDLSKDLIPVTPAAHYSCGGIKTDLYGRTNITNLFAFGEVACSGVHGANRLASNSLLEAVVFPLRLGEVMSHLTSGNLQRVRLPGGDRNGLPRGAKSVNPSLVGIIRSKLQQLMWKKVGIVRKMKELKGALKRIKEWEEEMEKEKKVSIDWAELKNMLTVARLVTEAAIRRKTSLGAHYLQEKTNYS